jgi:hypothetical protein
VSEETSLGTASSLEQYLRGLVEEIALQQADFDVAYFSRPPLPLNHIATILDVAAVLAN